MLYWQNEDLLQEHRVRFLSFLGINPKDEKYVKLCVCLCIVCLCIVCLCLHVQGGIAKWLEHWPGNCKVPDLILNAQFLL